MWTQSTAVGCMNHYSQNLENKMRFNSHLMHLITQILTAQERDEKMEVNRLRVHALAEVKKQDVFGIDPEIALSKLLEAFTIHNQEG